MFTERTCYSLSCDTCGNVYETMDGFLPHFDKPGDCEATDDDWVFVGNREYCEDCGAPNCTCNDGYYDHDDDGGKCDVEGCGCIRYAPTKR